MFCLPRKHAPRPHGFTLVEIMVVIVMIGLLAAIAIPAFQRVRQSAFVSRYANDFRQFTAAFEQFSLENGAWPSPTTTPGEIPSDMTAGYLPVRYSEPSPMGGGYVWATNPARIRLISTNATDAVMQKVDAMLDDGNLSTGRFSKMSSGGYHFLLE